MAALPTITDVVRCQVSGVCSSGQRWANLIHVKKDSGTSYASAITAIHAEIVKLYTTTTPYGAGTQAWKEGASTGAQVREVRYTPLDGSSASTVNTMVQSGLNAAAAMPSDTAIVVSFRTAKRGPRYRGRVYLAGYTESINDPGGVIAESSRIEMQATWIAFRQALVALATVDYQCVASYKFSTAEEILGTTINNVWDRQKRRSQ